MLIEKEIEDFVQKTYCDDWEKGNIQARLEFYEKVEEWISYYWNKYGSHAFMHHLSGIFGYGKIKTEIGF